MAFFFWDASALAKRYTAEMGRDTANALFASVPLQNMATTPWGYAETYSILLRRRNSGVLDAATFTASVTALQAEVVNSPDFALLPIHDATIFASVAMMVKHNLNATDAATLTMLLAYIEASGLTACVVVATDKRLLRAANEEGLYTLNPEAMPAADISDFLAALL